MKLPAPGIVALFALVFLAGTVMFSTWWPYHQEQAVVGHFEASGGTVTAEYDFVGPALIQPYSESEWLSWFRRIRRLELTMPQNGGRPDMLPDLSPLRRCESLAVRRIRMNEENVRRISTCPRLRSLRMNNCFVEVGALRGLDGHGHLSDIELTGSQVDGEVLELPAAPLLTSFRGNFNRSLRALDVGDVIDLRHVEVKNCGFDDEGVSALLEASQIEVLMMPNTNVSDAAIDDLLQLRSLRFLDLRMDYRLSRPEIERLADLPRLRTVAVRGAISTDHFDALRAVLPQATMDRHP